MQNVNNNNLNIGLIAKSILRADSSLDSEVKKIFLRKSPHLVCSGETSLRKYSSQLGDYLCSNSWQTFYTFTVRSICFWAVTYFFSCSCLGTLSLCILKRTICDWSAEFKLFLKWGRKTDEQIWSWSQVLKLHFIASYWNFQYDVQ